MNNISLRFVCLSLAFWLLAGCQSNGLQNSTLDNLAVDQQLFNQYLQEGDLDFATEHLQDMEKENHTPEVLAESRKRLADAWIVRGQEAVKQNDLEAASKALIQAKQLLPSAPALTVDLSKALSQAQQVKRPKASSAPVTAKPLPVAPKVSSEPAGYTDTLKVVKQVSLKALDKSDNAALLAILDSVAADVVKQRLSVTIEVRDTKDFHWVVALLMPRVKKHDAFYQPAIVEVIKPEQTPQILLSEKI